MPQVRVQCGMMVGPSQDHPSSWVHSSMLWVQCCEYECSAGCEGLHLQHCGNKVNAERLCIATASHTEDTAFSHMHTNSVSNSMHAS